MGFRSQPPPPAPHFFVGVSSLATMCNVYKPENDKNGHFSHCESGHGQNCSVLYAPLCCLIFPNSEILDPPLQAYILPRAILILLSLQTCRATNSPRVKTLKQAHVEVVNNLNLTARKLYFISEILKLNVQNYNVVSSFFGGAIYICPGCLPIGCTGYKQCVMPSAIIQTETYCNSITNSITSNGSYLKTEHRALTWKHKTWGKHITVTTTEYQLYNMHICTYYYETN